MHIVSAPSELRSLLKPYHLRDQKVGFVPTMGALHEGHLNLVEQSVLENEISVVSVFVNPIQFNNSEDLANYPKDLEEDIKVLDHINVNYLFAPSEKDLYPTQPCVSIDFGHLSRVLEGKFRERHFEGVGIVVSKLLHIVNPTRAYFGLKDLQQYLLIKRMCTDLNFPTEIVGVDTVREPSGLAMSSRNRRLSKTGIVTASALYSGLCLIEKRLKEGVLIQNAMQDARNYYSSVNELEIEYLDLINPENLESITSETKINELAICVAGYVEGIRLIDNLYLRLK